MRTQCPRARVIVMDIMHNCLRNHACVCVTLCDVPGAIPYSTCRYRYYYVLFTILYLCREGFIFLPCNN
jgi:hypothetical protein